MILTVTLNPAIDKALEVSGFAVGVHARARVLSLLPAGKGNNVARGVARLGGQATASGFVGRAENAIFVSSMARDGAGACFQQVDGHTRTNTTVLDPGTRSTTHLREEGFAVSAKDRAGLTARLLEWITQQRGGTVVFAGSLPRGMTPEHFVEMLTACAGAGADIVVDTNGAALRAACDSSAVSTLKPNLEEIGELTGRDIPRQEAVGVARNLCDRVENILLTLGADGAWLVREDAETGYHCPLAKNEVRNTVGCGDAFLAGWLRAVQRGAPLPERLSWAVAAGAASAMSKTTVGYNLRDVEQMLKRCKAVGNP